MAKQDKTTIQIDKKTHAWISTQGKHRESFSDILIRLLTELEKFRNGAKCK